MKYTNKEALAEIMRRSDQIMIKKSRRACRVLSCVSGVLFMGLVFLIALTPKDMTVTSEGSVYGAFMLSRESGGYVLVAVIAFTLGIAVTLLCLRYTKFTKQKKTYEEKEKAK
ncbi:MAG: YhcB family protein [Eubacterium sp.]|nr:YhcB family protein [Eubacterium sp.]